MTPPLDLDPAEPHLHQLLGIFSRRRRWIYAIVGIGTAVALVGSLAISPRYTAKAQMVFEPQPVFSGGDRQEMAQADEEAVFGTHITALTARPFLKQVLDSLSRDPAFQNGSGGGGVLRSLRNLLGGMLAFVGPAGDVRAKAEAARLDRFASSVNVFQERNSHVIAITFSSTSGEAAALAANRLAQLYIEGETKRKQADAQRAIGWLDTRIPEFRAGLERVEIGREATADEHIYQGLLQRREQLRAQQEAPVPDLRILSLASLPDRPSSFSPLLFFLPSIIVFCIGGCFLAVVIDRLDRGLHSAQDVSDALGIPCIGLVPMIREGSPTRPHEYLLGSPFSAYTEAIRSVVTNLQLAAPGEAPKVVLVTSSLPNEGKTTLAVSFAVYSAIIGRRTLLIDLDLRNPNVSRELGSQVEVDSLDVLGLGDRSALAAVRHVPGLDIDYLSVRCPPGEPLLPFVGGHVPRLVSELRQGYDCVYIDGPPLLPVAEARLLAAMADKVVLAVKWDSTRRDVVRETIDLLRDVVPLGAKKKPVEAVLTQVDLLRHAQYRYGGWESARAITGRALGAAYPPSLAKRLPSVHALAHVVAAADETLPAQRPEPQPMPSRLGTNGVAAAELTSAGDGGLALLLGILGEFHRQNVSYCYWKSSLRLAAALEGESDLDLLIARDDQHRTQAILLERGFKLFPDVASRLDPAVSSYLGFDEESGRLVHLHLHFRLVVGEPLLKNYRLPWESALLSRAAMHPTRPIRALDPASEALLLAVRAAVEPSRIDPVAARHLSATTRKFQRDREALAARLDPASLRRRACEVFSDDLADMLVDAVFSGRPLDRRRRLRRRIRRELAPHRAYSALEARLRSLVRALWWAFGNLNKRLLHLPRAWSRRAPGGGRVVAVIGVDGSGKSTVVANIRDWLGAEVDVMPAYFGTGDGRPSLLLLPLKMLVPVIACFVRTKPRGATHGRVSDRPPGPLYSVLMLVWAVTVAAEKRLKLWSAHRAASRGLVVIADRYPQNEDPEYSDGPLLPRLPRVPRWLRLFEARSYALASRLLPDLVIALEVTPEIAGQREPEMHAAAVTSRIESLRRLTFHGARLVRVSAEQPFSAEIHAIKREIWNLL